MASLPAQVVYTSTPVAGPSGSHPVPQGHVPHAHNHAYHASIPSLPQQERLPSIRDLDFQYYSQPQTPGPASNSISAQASQPPTSYPHPHAVPPPPQATPTSGSSVQRVRQQSSQHQVQHHSYGQVTPVPQPQQPLQHISESPALAHGQVPTPGATVPPVAGTGGVNVRGRAWGAPPPQPLGIPHSPAPPHSAASSVLGSGTMGAPPVPIDYQHNLPPPLSSASVGGGGGLHGHGAMIPGQPTHSLKRQRSESLAAGGIVVGSGAGPGTGLSAANVSASPAAAASGRSPHPVYTPVPPTHSYPSGQVHSAHGPPPASPYAPLSASLPAGQSAAAMSVNPTVSPAVSHNRPHHSQQQHQPPPAQTYDYSAYQTHHAQHPQVPPPYAQNRQTPIPSGVYGAPPSAELAWQSPHHAGPSHSQVQQTPPPGPPSSQSHPPSAPVQGYQQHISHQHQPQQPHQSPSYNRINASGPPVDTASTGRASVASIGSMGAPPPPTTSTSGLGGAFGEPSTSAGLASDYMAGAGTLSTSFSQPSSPSKGSSDLKEIYLRKIQENCRILYDFAQKHMSGQLPTPPQEEVQEMEQRAAEVVRLLEELRSYIATGNSNPSLVPKAEDIRTAALVPQLEAGRAPKRPWEDVSGDEDNFVRAGPYPQSTAYIATGDKMQSMAEKDMAIIRSKRATNSGALSTGAPKGKYRKRSRATPPGKCHSCNIRETPEWRRGPDGARTLCNACGLHYAKLMRKRDKNLGPDGRPVVIDLEMLRASTRAANEKEKEKQEQRQRENGGAHRQQNDPLHSQGQTQDTHSSPSNPSMKAQAQATQLQQQPSQLPPPPQYQMQTHTTATYQYPSVTGVQEGAAGMPPPTTSVLPGSSMGQDHTGSSGAAHQAWASSARIYGHESQSFMRTSHAGR